LVVTHEKNLDGLFSRDDVLSVSGDYGIVNQIEFQGRSFAGESLLAYRVVNRDDIVYTKSPLKANPYGIIKANLGESGIVSTLYAVYSPNKSDSRFINIYFDSDSRLNQYLAPLVNKGAKNDMKVSDENALLGGVVFPSPMEQNRIGEFFSMISALIATSQERVGYFKRLKHAYLQKLFL